MCNMMDYLITDKCLCVLVSVVCSKTNSTDNISSPEKEGRQTLSSELGQQSRAEVKQTQNRWASCSICPVYLKLLGYIRIQVLLNCLIDKVEGNTGKRHELCRWRNLQSSMQSMCLEACASQESSKDCIWTWSGRLMASNAKPEEDHPPWGNFFRNA